MSSFPSTGGGVGDELQNIVENSPLNIASILEKVRDLGCVNILAAGISGVGKSTLINTALEGELCTTGIGKPITKGLKKITKAGIPASIIDSEGFEASDSEIFNLLKAKVNEWCASTDPKDHVHVAWVCIAEPSDRIEPVHQELVAYLSSKNIPVVVVITKAVANKGLDKKARELLPSAREVVRVNSVPMVFDGGMVLPAHGVIRLVEVTNQLVPEAQRQAFVAAQRVSLELKIGQARDTVVVASSAAAAVGASPIPFSDAALLAPIQITMIARICAIFGFDLQASFIGTMLGGVLGASAASLLGRTIVTGLLKMIPGVGTVTGGVIAAGTAGMITNALGEAFIRACKSVSASHGGDVKTVAPEELAAAFKQSFTNR